MKRLDEANLTVELSTCQFLQREASFFEQIAGNEKIRPIKQFLGLAGYYCRFVKDFAKIAYPLSKLLREKDDKGKRPFMWGEKQQLAFETLREASAANQCYVHPIYQKSLFSPQTQVTSP